MPVFLDQIVSSTRGKVAERKRLGDVREMERRAGQHVPRGFRRALEEKSRTGVAVIAELKKASPSKGLIRAEFCAEELAKELEAAGAAALSVLTDEEFFQGSLQNLRLASEVVKIPCLRKDFIVDEFQLLEARANAADALLLIVAALTNAELNRLALAARLHELDVLCEVHDEAELRRGVDGGSALTGGDTGGLGGVQVDPDGGFRVAGLVPKNRVGVEQGRTPW